MLHSENSVAFPDRTDEICPMTIQDELQRILEKLKEDENIKVRVALFGQPGSGKSSIINRLIGKKVAETGQKTDTTLAEKPYEWNGLLLVDLPGYGTAQFPKETYFDDFELDSFDLFLCVFSGKIMQADHDFFQDLKKSGKICIFVRNKRDEIWEEGRDIAELEAEIVSDVRKQIQSDDNEIIFTSCRDSYGFDVLQQKIYENLEPAKKIKWAKGVKAYSAQFLQEKKDACSKYVYIAAGGAAANALNPIPGADIAVDAAVLVSLFASIRTSYGLTEESIRAVEIMVPTVAPVAYNIIHHATKKGIMMLLKKFIGRQTLKQISKYIPFVGQAVAASAGFGITLAAGMAYLDDCHKLSEEILKREIG